MARLNPPAAKEAYTPFVLPAQDEAVRSAAFGRDGRLVATLTHNGFVRVWDSASKTLLRSIRAAPEFPDFAQVTFGPDHRSVIVAGQNFVNAWDVDTGELTFQNSSNFSTGAATIVALSGDGQFALAHRNNGIEYVVAVRKRHTVWSSMWAPNIIAISPDSSIMMKAHVKLGQLSLIAVEPYKLYGDRSLGALEMPQERQYESARSVTAVAFSRDGRRVAAGWSNGSAVVWDVSTRKLIGATRILHHDTIHSVGFSPDGRWLVTGSGDGSARITNVESGVEYPPLLGHRAGVLSAVFSPDGGRIVTASVDRTAVIWDVSAITSGTRPRELAPPPRPVR